MLELGADPTEMAYLHGNGGDWATLASDNGLQVDTTPAVHSIAELDPIPNVFSLGHVAVVESVNPDGTITVTESSYYDGTDPTNNWNILWRNRTVSPNWFTSTNGPGHFIHVSFAGSAKTTPTVTLAPSLSTIFSDQPLNENITVTGASGNPTPTGTVTLTVGSFTSPATNLTNGTAPIAVPANTLAPNQSYPITANYSGDTNYNTAIGTGAVNVNSPVCSAGPTRAITAALCTAPTVGVSANPNSITTAGSTVVTVTVADNPIPTGTITLTSGGVTVGSGTLSGGAVQITVTGSTLAVGTDTVTASYSGDTNYNPAAGSTSITVTQAATAPTVATGGSANITTSSASVGGLVNPNGLATQGWFQYGTSSTLNAYQSTAQQNLGSGTSNVAFNTALSGLNPTTVYYFRAVGQNSAGTNYGSISSFNTNGSAQVSCSSYASNGSITGITEPFRLGFGDGKLVVSSAGQSYIINPVTDQITTIPFTSYPGSFGGQVSLLGSQAFIPLSNLAQGEIAVLDLSAQTVSQYFQVGIVPSSSVVIGSTLYIGDDDLFNNGNPSQVYEVNPASGQVVNSINAGRMIQSMASDPADSRLYALNYHDQTASAIDIDSNIVTATISLPIVPTAGVVVNGKLYVVGDVPTTQQGEVVEVDTGTNTAETTTLSVGRDPFDITAVNGCAFVPNWSDYSVSVVDLSANQVVKTITSGIGQLPKGAAVDPSTGYIYVANQGSNSISILGAQPLQTPAISMTPSSSSITTTQPLAVTVTVSGGTGNPTPTGFIVLTGGGYTSSATSLNGGSAGINIQAGELTTGSDTLTASYEPDSESSGIYNGATGSTTVAVSQAAAPVITWNPTVQIIFGDPGGNVLNATADAPGNFSYSAAPGAGSPYLIVSTSGLAVGTYTITATFIPSSYQYTGASSSTQLTVNGESVWIANGSGGVSELAGTGYGIATSAYGGGDTGVAIDNSGNVWTIGMGSTLLEETSQVGTIQNSMSTGGGLDLPVGLAIDGDSQVWVTNGNNSVSLLSNSGVVLSPSNGFVGVSLSTPTGIAIDLGGSVWIADKGNNSVTRLLGAAAPAAPISTATASQTTGAKP